MFCKIRLRRKNCTTVDRHYDNSIGFSTEDWIGQLYINTVYRHFFLKTVTAPIYKRNIASMLSNSLSTITENIVNNDYLKFSIIFFLTYKQSHCINLRKPKTFKSVKALRWNMCSYSTVSVTYCPVIGRRQRKLNTVSPKKHVKAPLFTKSHWFILTNIPYKFCGIWLEVPVRKKNTTVLF